MKRKSAAGPVAGLLAVVLSAACAPGTAGSASSSTRSSGTMTPEPFGTIDGKPVSVYTLRNANGVEARVTNYGGIILSLKLPDRNGRFDDVVLGYDELAGYLKETPYFGAIVGRYGNRIAGGRFTLDGKEYTLARNNGPNSLHGGVKGFDKVVWDAEPFQREHERGLVLTYTSPSGEEGFPGTLRSRVTYTLTDANELIFDYQATTDQATPVNLTQHSYFNLAGDGKGDVLGHVVQINASRFTPVDSTLIPTGELRDVTGTPFDFRTPTPIGARINQTSDQQIRFGGGYDHNFVLDRRGAGSEPELAARVVEPTSGRTMEVYTTEPGMQFYSGNFLNGTLVGKKGVVYRHRYGFAMETQHFPNSPNQPSFPSTILRPGQEYRSRTVYKFGVQR